MNQYNFKNPKFHIVDRDPNFLDFLKTNPSQTEARHYRNILMKINKQKIEWQIKSDRKASVAVIDLFSLPSKPHLTLVSL